MAASRHNEDMSRWTALTLAALCALLPLAWLQYVWAGQLAEAEQARLRAYLQSAAGRFSQDLDEYLARQPLRPAGPLVDAPAPYLLDPADPGLLAFRTHPGGEWALAEFDMKEVTTSLCPALFRLHFPASEGLEFDALLVDTASPPRTIWASRPGLTLEQFRRPDLDLGVLHYRPPGPPAFPPEAPPPGPPGPPGFQPEAPPPALLAPAPWRLLLRHRSGGLEQAVAVTRYRNLTLSAGVLTLLAAALAALTVATRRAERLARRQMEFVAGVSHELRTPLSVIGAAAGNLADGVVAAPPQVRQYGALIQSEGRRLTAMVEQILRYAGIQSGRVEPPPRPAELEPILQAAVQACSAELRENQVALDLRLEPGLPPVPADSAALTHCLRNLISNAALHGGVGGRIELAAARRDSQVLITVSDCGPGFAAEDLPHLFEPFYRGRAAVDAQTRGFGLGLALARRIAESHGGTLTAENRASGGARFLLTLPTCSQEAS